MTNAELIQKIRAEIERQMNFYDGKEREVLDDPKQFTYALLYQGHQRMCAKLLSFLSTLESGSSEIPNVLEEAANEYAKLDEEGKWKDCGKYKGFIAGAKWDRSQMMKEAIPCKVFWHDGPLLDYTQEQQDNALEKIGATIGDKVRIIIVKDD